METVRKHHTDGAVVRLKSVELEEVRCVRHGYVALDGRAAGPRGAGVLGVYGPAGTGKSTLMEALSLLKYILTGRTLPERFAWLPRIGAEKASLRYGLSVGRGSALYDVLYECTLRRETVESSHEETLRPVLEEEVLSWSLSGDGRSKMCPVVDTRTREVFLPATRREILIGRGRQDGLLAARRSAHGASRSFVFSGELLRAVRSNCAREDHRVPLEALVQYGADGLFLLDNTRAGSVPLGALLRRDSAGDCGRSLTSLSLPASGPALVSRAVRDGAREALRRLNDALTPLSHGRKILLEEQGSGMLADGTVGHRVQLLSAGCGRTIPLRLESEGFRRLASILPLLTAICADPSVTAVIEGIDQGMFEPLLGELLRLTAREGQGQLIFTAGMLRPLETLDRNHAAFTTDNPQHRYLRLIGVKVNNNLRDLYYRVLAGGGQKESAWTLPDWESVAKGLREAGNS